MPASARTKADTVACRSSPISVSILAGTWGIGSDGCGLVRLDDCCGHPAAVTDGVPVLSCPPPNRRIVPDEWGGSETQERTPRRPTSLTGPRSVEWTGSAPACLPAMGLSPVEAVRLVTGCEGQSVRAAGLGEPFFNDGVIEFRGSAAVEPEHERDSWVQPDGAVSVAGVGDLPHERFAAA